MNLFEAVNTYFCWEVETSKHRVLRGLRGLTHCRTELLVDMMENCSFWTSDKAPVLNSGGYIWITRAKPDTNTHTHTHSGAQTQTHTNSHSDFIEQNFTVTQKLLISPAPKNSISRNPRFWLVKGFLGKLDPRREEDHPHLHLHHHHHLQNNLCSLYPICHVSRLLLLFTFQPVHVSTHSLVDLVIFRPLGLWNISVVPCGPGDLVEVWSCVPSYSASSQTTNWPEMQHCTEGYRVGGWIQGDTGIRLTYSLTHTQCLTVTCSQVKPHFLGPGEALPSQTRWDWKQEVDIITYGPPYP